MGEIGIKAGFHGFDALQLLTNRFNILFLENLTVKCALISIVSEHIPCTENYVIKICQRNYITYMPVLLFLTATHSHLA